MLAHLLHRCPRRDLQLLTPLIERDLRTIGKIRPAMRISACAGTPQSAICMRAAWRWGKTGRTCVPASNQTRPTSEGKCHGQLMHACPAISCEQLLRPATGRIARPNESRSSAFQRWRECQVKRPLVPPNKTQDLFPDVTQHTKAPNLPSRRPRAGCRLGSQHPANLLYWDRLALNGRMIVI
jgi:hypothetical protein